MWFVRKKIVWWKTKKTWRSWKISNITPSYRFKKYSWKYPKWKIKKRFKILKFLFFLMITFLLVILIGGIILYKKYIEPLPPVEWLKDMSISEASVIYDSDWKELYKIFKENRTYVDYKNININMINALVAWEDKRFWENPWFDIIWLARAVLYRAIWKSDKFEGTSTLSQQLMKIMYLSNERKVERKVKEIYLSYKLNKVFTKEKILELYLNKIFFWNNSYWVEQASQTFFWVSASQLWVLQSSILASLPKWPSQFSVYSHPDRVLWYPYIYDWENIEEQKKLISARDVKIYKWIVWDLKDFIQWLKLQDVNGRALLCWIDKIKLKNNIRVDSDNCSLMEYSDLLYFLNSIKIKEWDQIIEYQTWRKDFILWRMLEDWYINFDQYKKSILDSIGYTFVPYKEKIKYPYFVIYVKEYLEKKYGKEVMEKWGFKIYTTINQKFQDKAEAIVKKYAEKNEALFWAKNAALVSIDNKKWYIVSMVWGKDYFDVENWWNNNMITSRLQPWSTFKPFVYALAIKNSIIWSKSPIYDVKTQFAGYSPANFDGKFMWKMTLVEALNHSRNIPAIKMFYIAWWEEKIIKFMKTLWVETLINFKKEYFDKYDKNYAYWASMSLWTWLMTPLELASAYSVFANLWDKKKITPILKIEDSNWNIIEDNTIVSDKKNQVISDKLAYIITSMLTDTSSRPEWWNTILTIKNAKKIAAKTWTSTKQFYKNWVKKIYPRNIWTAWYTPYYTTVVWWWNTDWTELFYNWNWLEWAWKIWHDFMEVLHEWLENKSWKKPSWLSEIKISKLSGLLLWDNIVSDKLIEKSFFINKPKEVDNNLKEIEVDALCNWKVWDNTPPDAIKKWNLLSFHSYYPENPKWEEPVQKWISDWINSPEYIEEFWAIKNIITNYTTEECNRTWNSKVSLNSSFSEWNNIFIWSNYIEIWFRANRPIIKVQILINNKVVRDIKVFSKMKKFIRDSVIIPKTLQYQDIKLTIKTIDNQYYSTSKTINLKVQWKDKTIPEIVINNDEIITLKMWEIIDITWKILDTSSIRSINYYVDWKAIKLWTTSRNFKFKFDSNKVWLWNHIIKIESYDSSFNYSSKNIEVIVLQ